MRLLTPTATALLTAATLAVAGCGAGGDGGATKVAYSNPVGAQPGQQDIVFGFRRAAAELGWRAASIDANLSPDKQVADIATMVTQRQDGIASWTLDPGAAAGAYVQARAAGIPVVGVNSAGTGIDATVWWELNLCGAGSPIDDVAAAIAKARPGGAQVLEIGGPPVPSVQANERCFARSAAAHGLKVVATAHNSKDTAAPAQAIVADLLTKHPGTDAIWAYNDATALGASAALTADRREVYDGGGADDDDDVMVFGINGDVDAITAIRDHRLTGTIDPDPVATGWALVKALAGFVGDDRSGRPPTRLVVKSDTWTLDNIEDYRPPRERAYTLDTVPLVDAATR
jgi:ribose transport system substrate-binding protein